jgi:hypothetical protein
MPYALSLQAFGLPEFYQEAPEAWVRRLREISPITENLSHLRFRWREPQPHWFQPDRGQWELYSCTPRHLVSEERAEQFQLHWSELPTGQQVGRKAMVTSYQHYLWHVYGVEARRFWVLQGEWGGTAAQYTPREVRYLDACDALSEPLPLGFFPACPFDERATKAIQERDRLIQVGNRFDALEKLDRPEALKAEDEAAEKLFRQTFLDKWYATMQPQAEFMKQFLSTADAHQHVRKATHEEANRVTQWKEQYVDTGIVPGAGIASSRKVHILVK